MFAHMVRRGTSSASVAVAICLLLILATATGADAAITTPTPTGTPGTPGTAGGGSEVLPSVLFLVLFLGTSMIAIAIALGFALKYHRMLISFMGRALAHGKTYDAEAVQTMAARGLALMASPASPRIIGAESGTPGQEMVFLIDPPLTTQDGSPTPVTWLVDGKPVKGFTGNFLKHTFKKGGEFVIEAKSDGTSIPLFKVAVATAAGGNPSLPFAIENWGRMVIMLFGLGVVGALMSIEVLSSEAGAGLLGAMLGIGAAAVASTSGTKAKGPADDGDAGGAPEDGKGGNDADVK